MLSTSLGKKHVTRSDLQLDSSENNLHTWSAWEKAILSLDMNIHGILLMSEFISECTCLSLCERGECTHTLAHRKFLVINLVSSHKKLHLT